MIVHDFDTKHSITDLFAYHSEEVNLCLSSDWKIINANPRFSELTGFEPHEYLSIDLLGLVHEKFRQRALYHCLKCMSGKITSVILSFNSKSGETKNVRLKLIPNQTAEEAVAYVIIAWEQPQNFLDRSDGLEGFIKGQEKRQKQLSRRLHDGLSQFMAASLMYIKQLQNQLVTDPKEVSKLAGKAVEVIESGIDEIQSISNDLMPGILKDFGLEMALKNMCYQLNEHSTIEVIFKSKGISRLDKDLELGLFRIAQEALNNAIKHSDADFIVLELRSIGKSVELNVRDNGSGFAVYDISTSESNMNCGYGIFNMNHRANLLGLDLVVKSSPGNGTSVKCIS